MIFDALPLATKDILMELFKSELAGDFYLIGGTGLSIQTGHRPSEDLDFSTLREKIDSDAVSVILNRLRENGHTTKLAMNQGKISQARINGYNLLDYVRDYLIDDRIKLTFVALRYDKNFCQHISGLISTDNIYQFPILSIEGIFSTKALVIEKRIKSRDLFDLHYMMINHGFTIQNLFTLVSTFGENGTDYAKSVLTGEFPLDEDDEGFSTLGISVPMDSIYQYFSNAINDYETDEAKNIIASLGTFKPY